MSIFTKSNKWVHDLRARLKQDKTPFQTQKTKHAPKPLQRRPDGQPAPLKLNNRRVTLSRSARKWSRGIVWSLVGLTGFSVVYGCLARIETSVEASGKLEPSKGVTKVSAPFAALAEDILVKNGEKVVANQPLIRLRDDAAIEQIKSLRNNKKQVLRDISITRERLGLPALDKTELDIDAQKETDIANRETILRQQINELEVQRAMHSQAGEANVLKKLQQRANISYRTLDRLKSLYKAGAVSELMVDQEKQRLLDTEMQLQKQKTLVDQTPLHTSAQKLRTEHVMVQEKRDLYKRQSDLQHQLADISRQLAEQQKKEKLLVVRAPKAGIVFDLALAKGELASPNTPILEVIPEDSLQARVMIPNKDIGFVKEGMPTEVRIASYPFTEYGAIKGHVTRLGANSKATNPNIQTEHYPAIITMDSATLNKGGSTHPLKPGMSVTSLIKLGSRPAISLLSDRIIGLFDGVRKVR